MENAILGSWDLISFEVIDHDDQKTYPFGENVTGLLMYEKNGKMSVIFGRKDRKKLNFKTEDIGGGTDLEKIKICERFTAYCGKYEIKENKITHHIEMSFFPNWIDTQQIRYFNIKGDKLKISTGFFFVLGKEQKIDLVWKRSK